MSNQQLIKSAHIWFLTALLVCGLVAIAVKAGSHMQSQNSNQNSNSNSNSNSNANSSTQNRNDNRSGNRNSGNMNIGAAGEQTGMASMNSKDRDFLMDVAMGGLVEVELGRLAAQRGSSEAIKQFGQRMVDDHGKANTELMSLASSKGLTLPTSLDEKHQKAVTKLSAMQGADFDRAYAKMMLKDHEKHVSEFEKQSTKATDADVKAFASKTLPTLQDHLTMARALPGNERRGGNSNSNSNSGGSKNSNRNSNNSNNP